MKTSWNSLRKAGVGITLATSIGMLAGCGGDDTHLPLEIQATAQHPALEEFSPKNLGDVIEYYNDHAAPGEDWTDTATYPSYEEGQLVIEFRNTEDALYRSTKFEAWCSDTTLVTRLFEDNASVTNNVGHAACQDSDPGPGEEHTISSADNVFSDTDILVKMPPVYTPRFMRPTS